MAVDSCRATRARGEQSEELFDLRSACLEDGRAALSALAQVLAGADLMLVARSVDAARK